LAIARVLFVILILSVTHACNASDNEATGRRATITDELLLTDMLDACLLLDESLAEGILGSAVTAQFSQPIVNRAMSQCGWYRSGARPPGILLAIHTWARTQLGQERLGDKYGETVAGYYNMELVREIDGIGRWAGLVRSKQGNYGLIATSHIFFDTLSPGVATHGTHLRISHVGLSDADDAQAILVPIAQQLLDRFETLAIAEAGA